MSRREHTSSQSYIDWLKSIGCLVYLPLSEDGDLQDRISGLSLTFSGNGSMVWNANENAYVVTSPSSNSRHTAILSNGLNKTSFPDDCFSVLCKVKAMLKNGTYARTCAPHGYYDSGTSTAFGAGWNGSGYVNNWPADFFDFGAVVDSVTRQRYSYQNGTLYVTAAEYANLYPSNWQLTGNGVILGVVSSNRTGHDAQFAIKDLYIFNTVLDLATIRKIQGFE